MTNRNVVVETATPGNYAFIDHTSRSNNGRPLIGLVAAGMAGPSQDVPEGASVFAVDGLGVLLATDDGTQLIRGARLEPFSDHRVLAARSTAWTERRCLDGSCGLVLVIENGDGERSERTFQRVPAPQTPEAILSPDLRWLIYPNVDGGPTDVWNVDEAFRSQVPLAVPVDASWSPDSQFFAWTERGRLVAVFPATGEVVQPVLPFDAIDGSVKILLE